MYGAINNETYIGIKNVPQNPPFYDINIYTMNSGDEFNVRIINKNTTIASTLFNSLTLGASSETSTRIYINYGTTILNETYRTFLDSNR